MKRTLKGPFFKIAGMLVMAALLLGMRNFPGGRVVDAQGVETGTPTDTPTPTFTLEPSPTFTLEPSPTPTLEPSSTPTLEPSSTPIPKPLPTFTQAPSRTASPAPNRTPTPAPSRTAAPALTRTRTPAPPSTATPGPTRAPALSPTRTATLAPTRTATATIDRNPRAALVVPAGAQVIPDQYIVVYKKGLMSASAAAEDANAIRASGGKVNFVYAASLQGYSAYLPPRALEKVRQNPLVDYIEADRRISMNDEISTQSVQTSASWGLDRIDQRNLPLSSSYTYTTTASNVNVYVLDTGIQLNHTQFATGRAVFNYDAFGGTGGDLNGHGTQVAGIIGGTTYGVAKGVQLHDVRVLDEKGSGTLSTLLAGIFWVTRNHIDPAVANLSLGGAGSSATLENAIQVSIAAGVTYVISAGNDNANACNYTPARVTAAITVGSTTSTDARSSFSNWGTCLDLFAPGSSISSAWIGSSNAAVKTNSGTSMSAPYVSGVAALYLALHPAASPLTVRNALFNNATPNKVTSPGTGSPNRLLNALFAAGPTLSPGGIVGDTHPAYQWYGSPDATSYRLQVVNLSTGTYIINVSVPKTYCSVSSLICTYHPATPTLVRNNYQFHVMAEYPPQGTSTYSEWRVFSYLVPAIPITISPGGFISDPHPPYRWYPSTGASSYRLQVVRLSPVATILTVTVPASACSGTPRTCTYHPAAPVLSAGNYQFHVAGVNGSGSSAFSGWRAFIYGPPVPLVPATLSPSGTISDSHPPYRWYPSTGASSYRLQVVRLSPVVTILNVTVPASACSGTPRTCTYHPAAPVLSAGNYQFHVAAVNTSGSSAFSAWRTFAYSAPSTGFNSQFNGNSTGWQAQWGAWSIYNGINYRSTGLGAGTYSSTSYATNFADFDFSAQVKRTDSGTSSFTGLIVRGTPGSYGSTNHFWNNAYYFAYSKYGHYAVMKNVNGVLEFLTIGWGDITSSFDPAGWNILRVKAVGNTFNFYINGNLVWTGTDPTSSFSSGRVGFIFLNGLDSGNEFLVDYATLSVVSASSAGSASTDLVMDPTQAAANQAALKNPGRVPYDTP